MQEWVVRCLLSSQRHRHDCRCCCCCCYCHPNIHTINSIPFVVHINICICIYIYTHISIYSRIYSCVCIHTKLRYTRSRKAEGALSELSWNSIVKLSRVFPKECDLTAADYDAERTRREIFLSPSFSLLQTRILALSLGWNLHRDVCRVSVADCQEVALLYYRYASENDGRLANIEVSQVEFIDYLTVSNFSYPSSKLTLSIFSYQEIIVKLRFSKNLNFRYFGQRFSLFFHFKLLTANLVVSIRVWTYFRNDKKNRMCLEAFQQC